MPSYYNWFALWLLLQYNIVTFQKRNPGYDYIADSILFGGCPLSKLFGGCQGSLCILAYQIAMMEAEIGITLLHRK
jgi:hypothetical protein